MLDSTGETDESGPDVWAIVKTIVGFFVATTFKRVLSSMMAFGATLLGLSWVDLIAIVLETFGYARRAEQGVDLVQLVGIVMIAIGFGGHLILFLLEKREERRKAEGRLRDAGAMLVGRLRVLVDGFRDPAVKRDEGYYNNEIIQCAAAAKAFRDVAPPEWKADATLAAIHPPKIDASKRKPLYDVELADLEALAARIQARYEIEFH